jgi:hypothetical protein
MFCPNCLYEYEKGIKKCTDCGAALVSELPPEDEGADPNLETASLTDVDDDVEADAIRAMLEEKDIYSFLKTNLLPHSGIILAGIFGKNRYGTIIINKEDLKRAKEVLEDYRKSTK